MKKLMVVVLVLGFLALNSSSVFADWFSPKPAAEKTPAAVQQPPVVKKPVKVENKTQELIAKKKADLNNTQWSINTKPMSGKGKADKDILTFVDGKITSKNMEGKGFAGTNFSMRLLEDNETYTWETMQVSEKEGTAFWRGDIGADGVMRGVMSVRNKKNVVSDYNFNSTESKKMELQAPAETPAVPAAPAAAAVTAAPAPKK